MSDSVADLLRLATLVCGAFTIAATAVTTVVYYVIWHRFHRDLPSGTEWRGRLPRHVAIVGVSYMVLVGYTMHDVMHRLGSELTWKAPILLGAYLLGFWALWEALGSSRHRYHDLRTSIPLEDDQ